MAKNSEGNNNFLYASLFIGNLVAFSAGISTGWSSPVIVKLTNETRIDENPLGAVLTIAQESWIISIVGLGAVFGPFLSGYFVSKFGRKKVLVYFSGVPLLISYLMLAFGKTVILYYISRFISGLAVGTLLSVLPNFLSEISEDSVRGKVSSSIDVFLMSGTLFAYIVGPYVSIMWFNISCAVWPALFSVLFLFVVPETPYYLIAANDHSGAIKSLRKFRSTTESNVMKELETMKSLLEHDQEKVGSFMDLFKSKASIKGFIITISLLSFQQLSGLIVILFNAQAIFSLTGSTIPPEISTIVIGAVQFATSFITPFTIDRLGRRILLLISAVGMCIAELPLGLYFYLKDNGTDVSGISWLPLVCLILYITFYNFGYGFVPWTVMSEVFPSNIKGPASIICACYGSLLCFAITKCFAPLNAVIGIGGTFWIFAAFCAIAIPFLMFYMIETKGKSFQEIQNMLSK